MIGAQAKASFERIFFDAARTRLATGGACDIAPAADEPPRERRSRAKPAAQVAVLTISALHFRLLLALRFNDDDATRRYYTGVVQADAQPSLQEAFMEVANLCCGAMNQALTVHFPDLGMSTPYLLSDASIEYFTALAPGHVAAFDVTLGDGVRIRATLCICANAPVDFHAPATAAVDAGGELELF
ncbi:hypothetical protein [Burkholderia ubonensis]|uniref:hypothetical protein n=1 Tax=Burkholderia ubonensis TaxID=101571 RepID=UPI000759C0D9|nr:hypothetical protein [Burkholderia ubonensis]AOK61633.1 hypothetical protein WM29_20950 [Burkholderia ubonensis]KVS41529.1 hypothetical protein WK38_29470 [Burkholderia ubonensis]KVS44303.1 hypothetical protein WK37_13170 [Burkholderia ubonensis]KVS76476.1 hypothetical protein WK42_01165 [Burkholderia ubonensis]KVS89774.1 hypothetical protein WK44_16605 [Burkholderia ubonensis]